MSSANLDPIMDAVASLNSDERLELRRRLESWPESLAPELVTEEPMPPPKDEAEMKERLDLLNRRLLAKGIIKRIPDPPTEESIAAFRAWKPIEIPGKPVSETLIEERR